LTAISENPSTGQYSLSFADGSTATASAVIACDGIKSVARQQYVLSSVSDQRVCRPVFANEYAYRGMFSRSKFLEVSGGTIPVGKGILFCGPDSYAVMYPVEKGSLMNVVAIKRISTDTAASEFASLQHETNWTQPVTTETMLSDFEAWGEPIKNLLRHIEKPERWALYDHLPAPTYVKGRVALMGDAAHATTPHQGQGAGMAFEDSFILSTILGKILNEPGSISEAENNKSEMLCGKIESCFRAYDEVRRPRTQAVTRTSREMGELLGFAGEGTGRNLAKMKVNFDTRMNWIWDVDLLGEVEKGVKIAKRELNSML